MVRLLSLPWEVVEELLGDGIDSPGVAALWKTSDGDSTHLVGLIENTDASEYCRGSAVTALSYGVADGGLSRQEVLEVFHRVLLRDDPSSAEEFVRSCVAFALGQMWPGDSKDVLREAFERDLLDPWFIGLDDIDLYLQRGAVSWLLRNVISVRR